MFLEQAASKVPKDSLKLVVYQVAWCLFSCLSCLWVTVQQLNNKMPPNIVRYKDCNKSEQKSTYVERQVKDVCAVDIVNYHSEHSNNYFYVLSPILCKAFFSQFFIFNYLKVALTYNILIDLNHILIDCCGAFW